ncbi:SDR family NAD(P)-dependent oxidoreductase [Microvirga puerhi]|uniref:SDR family NAD(P)-dependent oxidoreductase n=1 Tax=Microvirga puerhi TaxID=2876078 RepID=A0ABS7VWK6_9HYPH|nr:SDR family NAD(P)-dependent oxidoreductase [Microvirga puerhi]MBZ6079287.1 SDR family NAD(P)-dependent oxidoreductase [Microvirga puerhi]
MTSALLIGMGPGLGRSLVRTFALDGHKVSFVGRRAEEIARHQADLRAEGLDVTGYAGDAGEPEVMDRIHGEVAQKNGPPDVLIYNAAVIEPSRFVTCSGMGEVKYGTAPGWASLGEPATREYVLKTLNTNVVGALHAVQSVAPAMIERGAGTILLTGGVLAFGPWLEWGPTSLGKAALRSLGLSLDKELRPAGIHVCTIAIHGTMQAGTLYDHDLVAQAYLGLHHMVPEEWRPEFHFRPDDAGADPDSPEAR